MKIRVGKFLISTNANGPGRRLVIWLQGCPILCKHCFNPEFWDESGGVLMDIDEIIAKVELSTPIEGVTFTGGEPLIQAKNLLPLAKEIKSRGLSIVCFTGYLYNDIMEGKIPYARDLLRYFDILIDGPYIVKEKSVLLWRGSKNQKIYFLSDRYKHFAEVLEKEDMTEVELQISENILSITGIFDQELWNQIKNEIKK